MGVYKGSQSSPSTISRRAEQHTRKHWDEQVGGVGAVKGTRKRKYTNKEGDKEEPRAKLPPPQEERAIGAGEEESGAKVEEAVAALIGLGSGDESRG